MGLTKGPWTEEEDDIIRRVLAACLLLAACCDRCNRCYSCSPDKQDATVKLNRYDASRLKGHLFFLPPLSLISHELLLDLLLANLLLGFMQSLHRRRGHEIVTGRWVGQAPTTLLNGDV